MDEVDFTILAATSVLGDLIDKCPPAEACRDAFDRMSKATVQMCISTTGFSSSAQGLNSRRSHSNQNSDYFSNSKGKRVATPIFDMGLNDLLGPTQSPIEKFRNGSVTPGTPKDGGVKGEFTFPSPTQQNTGSAVGIQMHSPTNFSITPPLDSTSIDPSLLPSPTSYSSVPVSSQQPIPIQNQFQDLSFPNSYNGSGIDFLGGGNGNSTGWEGFDANGSANWGGDLGVGLGWEGADHDFSEGGNGGLPDLFEGFFFGGTGNF
jgi:hypothetical protein